MQPWNIGGGKADSGRLVGRADRAPGATLGHVCKHQTRDQRLINAIARDTGPPRPEWSHTISRPRRHTSTIYFWHVDYCAMAKALSLRIRREEKAERRLRWPRLSILFMT